MRIVIALAALAALSHVGAAPAQTTFVAPGSPGNTMMTSGTGPKTGQLEVKAYEKIPKAKTAVQLTNDSSMARNIRREVMVRLARRGNEVGYSGGNVMRLEVTYFDLGGNNSGAGQNAPTSSVPAIEGPGSNPRLDDLPRNKLQRRDAYAPPPVGPVLRVTLTLYDVHTGKVLWAATASCNTQASTAETSGLAMVDAIFTDPDNSRIADASCPL